MQSFELLARAADSLGMRASRDGTKLTVLLGEGTALHLSVEGGGLVRSVRFGNVPAWVWTVSSALVGGMATLYFLLYPTNRLTLVLVFLALSGLVRELLTSARNARLQEKLFDRAYDMGKLERSTA
jgi:hypothetical protein